MGQRETRKAGILKPRLQDQNLQKTLEAIIERLEVLDGLRGDALDQAITYRDLGASGFDVSVPFSGGTPSVVSPDNGGPTIGPALAPSNLAANETFLALLLTWDNPSFNLQHIEVWRATTDNLSLAGLIGTTVAPFFVDYVGGNATFYYWVRAVGTDGTYSAFNDTAGTVGTTGVDPSDFEAEINISTANLDAALAARIDLIDNPTTGLVDRLNVAEGDIVAIDARTTSLESNLAATDASLAGTQAAVNANASSLSTQSTSISVLQSDVASNSTDIASNVSAIAANAANILSLEANIGAIDASAGQTWDFLTDLEGFTAANATVTHSGGALVFTPTGSNPQLTSDTISVSGGINTQVVVRLRQTIAGGAWEGTLFYQTAGHIMSASYQKVIPDPGLVLSQWTTLTWDMSDLTNGGDDWVNSTIEAIRLDLVSTGAGKFEIDYILIAKFSTAAISEALEALDVRVSTNETDISANTTNLTSLNSTVNNISTGVSANAAAISSLQTNVSSNDTDIAANVAAITALQTTVNDGATGVAANASAIDVLQADVSNNDGLLTAQAQSITQLVASIDGFFASAINPLRTLNEGYGTTYSDSDVQSYSIGGRTGVGGKTTTAVNVGETMYLNDGTRIKIEPRGIYELKYSIYHDRGAALASFNSTLIAYDAVSGGSNQVVSLINGGAVSGTGSSGVWLQARQVAGNEWIDVTCYILGDQVNPAACPDMLVNGVTTNSKGFLQFNDGVKVPATGRWVEIIFSNLNLGADGNGLSTSLWVTDVSLHRIDTVGTVHAAIQTESTVRASETGDLNAIYAVKAELSTGGDPYITGFGLAADVIAGTASSSFGIRADQFFITSPTFGTAPGSGPGTNENSAFPFIVDLVNGVAQVAIDGTLIVDGTIRAESIVAGTIGAAQIDVDELEAYFISAATIEGQLIRTAPPDPLQFRVEIEGDPTAYPLWYGSGAKAAAGGRFYVDASGNVTVKGLLDAGMIKQSYFAPADSNNSFRIACDYPSSYSAGVYTGKKAHLMPALTTGYQTVEGSAGYPTLTTKYNAGWASNKLRFYSPTYTGTVEYGRLGTLSETLLVRYSSSIYNQAGNVGGWLLLRYQYDAETARYAYIYHGRFWGANLVLNAEDIFITRETPWSTLDIWIDVGHEITTGYLQSANLTVQCANFGYADLAGIVDTAGATTSIGAPLRNPNIIKRYE